MTDTVSTGVDGLDDVLGGGLPRGRSLLLSGGPGTGKTTIGMSFLQAGLAAGEECLFLTTEQTPEEVAESLSSFAFDLDHERLTITTLHMRPGRADEGLSEGAVYTAFEDDSTSQGFVLRSLEGGQFVDEHRISFTPTHVREYLKRLGTEFDRVLLDSASGLATMASDFQAYRRGILDLLGLFANDFRATTLLTAERSTDGISTGFDQRVLEYSTHGAVRLWKEDVAGSMRRFVAVEKLRGTDHDARRFGLRIDDAGVHVVPRNRARPAAVHQQSTFATGIEGLDSLLGGGLSQGKLNLVTWDGLADLNVLLGTLLNRGLVTGRPTVVQPSTSLSLDALDRHLWDVDEPIGQLLEEDRLFCLSTVDRPGVDHRNVHVVDGDSCLRAIDAIHQQTAGSRRLVVLDADALRDVHGPDHVMQRWRETAASLLQPDDVVVVHLNERQDRDRLQPFLEAESECVVRFWKSEDGMEFLKAVKSPAGSPGSNRLVEYVDDPPYLALY